MMQTGEEQAWEILSTLTPEEVCKRAIANFDQSSKCYVIKVFGHDIIVSLKQRKIFGHVPETALLLNKLRFYSILSILWYLIHAKDIPTSGKLVKPENLKGGQIYSKGSHVLPLDQIVKKYARDMEGFLKKGKEYGGEQSNFADVSLMLFPFPRIPVFILLWAEDDEFPPRADLLFDAVCEFHMPPDIIWSTAMMSVKVLL